MVHPLQERLLTIMDRKDHWAWPRFTQPGLSKDQLLVHFRHEYQVYVRDFPVLLARTLGLGPPAKVRAALAENIYEEQTGKLSVGVPHPELFVDMMSGIGITRAQLEATEPALEPEAIAYRAFLDEVSVRDPWPLGAAALTIFVEGSRHERADVEGTREHAPIETAIAEHPLVKHYGCPPEKMRLARAHREVEGDHRDDAWSMILDYVPESGALFDAVFETVERSLTLWLSYRDGVARAMGLSYD